MLRKLKTTLVVLCYICLLHISFSSAANIYIVSESDNLIKNCQNNIDILVDTQWEEIFWISTNILYDRKNIQIDGFYINDLFNLPLDIQNNWIGNIKSAALSMIRWSEFKQTGFSGIVKFATLVITNKEPINDTKIDFLFSWKNNRTDNMDVFRVSDAQDILQSATWWVFTFVDGKCLHEAPSWVNQLDMNYDYKTHIGANIENITKLEKQMHYQQRIQKNIQILSYILVILLLIILIIIMYKKWLLENIHLNILKNKKNENA